MTRVEVQKLLAMVQATYPNFKPEDATLTVDTWLMFLGEYEANEVLLAFRSYTKSNNSGFAPSVSQLISELEKPNDLSITADGEALAKFRKALSNSTYHAKEEYEKLNPTMQKAIGSADMLHFWATQETDEISVLESNFLKSYRQVCVREKTYNKMPKELQARTNALIEKNTLAISDNTLVFGTQAPQLIDTAADIGTVDTSKYMERLKGKFNGDQGV